MNNSTILFRIDDQKGGVFLFDQEEIESMTRVEAPEDAPQGKKMNGFFVNMKSKTVYLFALECKDAEQLWKNLDVQEKNT